MQPFDDALQQARKERRRAVRRSAWRENVTTGERSEADRDLREVESRLMELEALRRRR